MAQTWDLPLNAGDSVSGDRANINDFGEALRTLHSGATAPSSTVAYMLWADTTATLLKMRNSADSGWLELGTLAANLGMLRIDGSSAMTGNLEVNGADNLILDLGRAGDTANARIDFDAGNLTSIRASAANTLDVEVNGSDVIQITATVLDTAHELRAGADVSGAASHVTLTNTASTDVTGTTVTLGGDNILTNVAQDGWLKLYSGTTAVYVPYWT